MTQIVTNQPVFTRTGASLGYVLEERKNMTCVFRILGCLRRPWKVGIS